MHHESELSNVLPGIPNGLSECAIQCPEWDNERTSIDSETYQLCDPCVKATCFRTLRAKAASLCGVARSETTSSFPTVGDILRSFRKSEAAAVIRSFDDDEAAYMRNQLHWNSGERQPFSRVW
eukprot:TRINITY_DN75726_c0_g1_i1.p1 TRINITY_DN75726_c0_g1~~TRINITY_DN75726_c0_g1_i1.p1  ORF type:complete len:144 (+),score=11.29 TRINITY_DN75726_c0_g1_i1:66-434(+)